MQPPIRPCDGCTMCCKVMGIAALNKPRGIWCTHCQRGVGCRIHEKRPEECRSFACLWLVDGRLGPEWRPDKSRLVITPSDDGGLEIRCDPGYPMAWRKEPYYSQILDWARAVAPQYGTVTVCVGKMLTLVSVDGEFALGTVNDDERIVRDFSGKRLIGVRVVKAEQSDKQQG